MATAPNTQQDTSAEDISDQEEQEDQEQQQEPTGDTPGNGAPQQPENNTVSKDAKLPDDHPVVKQLATEKAKRQSLNTELTELRSKSQKVTQLEDELKSRPTQEALDTLQTRYERLEAFTQAVGLGKALDSRSFTRDLFETDKDIADLVKEWNRANPTATSRALGGSPADGDGSGKVDANKLIRAAWNGGQK